MSCLVVYDTNVLVSYLLPSTKVSAVKIAVAQIFDKQTTPVFSHDTMAEYIKVLHYDKFDFLPSEINELLVFILCNGLYVNPAPSSVLFSDTSDKPFYDAARAAGAWLVTGNTRHFPHESFIVSPREYLERVRH